MLGEAAARDTRNGLDARRRIGWKVVHEELFKNWLRIVEEFAIADFTCQLVRLVTCLNLK